MDKKLNWNFSWQLMNVFLGEKSAIDVPKLNVHTYEEATDFLLNYGFDPDDTDDQKYGHAIFIEALNFIELKLLNTNEDIYQLLPKEITLCEDVRDLILWSSSKAKSMSLIRAWSCSILRVMHTIFHIDGLQRKIGLDEARKQIFNKFNEHISKDNNGKLWLGKGEGAIEIEHMDLKMEKPRQSIILKLLHKETDVATTIFDLIGVRFVTKRLCDVMLAVKYFYKTNMISFPNCLNYRSRNTLIDIEAFISNNEMLLGMLNEKKINEEEFELLINRLTIPLGKAIPKNKHSSKSYKSIQLTCHQYIKMANPLLKWKSKLSDLIIDNDLNINTRQTIKEVLEYISLQPGLAKQEIVKGFFPFEVQIIDSKTYKRNCTADAAHRYYKRSQIRSARKRILSGAIDNLRCAR